MLTISKPMTILMSPYLTERRNESKEIKMVTAYQYLTNCSTLRIPVRVSAGSFQTFWPDRAVSERNAPF